MKNLNEYLFNEVKSNLSALYLKSDDDNTFTLNKLDKNGKPVKLSDKIELISDNEFGFFFVGKTEDLKKLSECISEETHLEEDCF